MDLSPLGILAQFNPDEAYRALHGPRLALPPGKVVTLAPTVEMATAYQALFDYFNEALFRPIFGEVLPHPVLNLSRNRRATAFFAAKSWRDPQTGQLLDEISLVPEWTGRDPRRVLSSLVHEMAHQKDHTDGTDAKTPGYHGRTWFKIMARLGLPPKPLSATMLNVTHEIDDDGAYAKAFARLPRDLYLPFITSRPKTEGVAGAKPETLHGRRAKYVCPGCNTNMRGPSGKKIRCMDCDLDMAEVGF